MGRLTNRRARWLLTAVTVVALPLVALLGANLRLASGAPVLTLVLAVLVAHVLSIGPRAYPVAWWGMLLEATVTRGAPLDPAVLLVTAAQAAVVVLLVRLLEVRFAHHGPVRSPIVMVEFGLVAAVATPVALGLVVVVAEEVLHVDLLPGSLLHCAAATGIGVLSLTPGLRMVIRGQVRQLDRTRVPAALATAVLSGGAVLALVVLGGEGLLVATQLFAVPVIAIALLLGTIGYSLAVGAAALVVSAVLALTGATSGIDIATTSLVTWWVLGFVGLLLATDGDSRRATSTEFRSFFMRSATPSVTVNTSDGRVLRANDAVADLFATTAAGLVGRPMEELLPDDDELRSQLRQLRLGELDEISTELALSQVDGDERWVRCSAVRVELWGPQHDVLQLQFVDLTTERTRAMNLERTNESLEQFGRRVTHDLKQPVSAVAAYAATLLEHGDRMQDEMVRTMHERLARAARRAVQQLDDTFAAAAAKDPGRIDIRLHELVADVVGVVDLALNEAGATVATNLMRGRVRSDPASIRQILLNLLTNSLKYHRPGTAPRINVSSRVRGAGVEITVTDNGIGLPPTALDEVFTRGVRLTPERADGRGHGLADSRELAASLGGTLRAEPWPDGARFVLWLPDPAAADAQVPTRVLVVADGDVAPEELAQRLGHRSSLRLVGAVTSVADAVVAARDTRPDVVLLAEALVAAGGDHDGVVEIARAHRDARIVLLLDAGADDDTTARGAGAVRAVDLHMDDDRLVGGLLGTGV